MNDTETPKVTLSELLSVMTSLDDCLLNLDLDEMKALGESVGKQVAEKVDGYKFVIDRINARVEELTGQIDELYEVKKALEIQASSIKRRLAEVMDLNGFQKLMGERCSVRLGSSEALHIDPTHILPTDEDLAYLPPSCIKTKHEWIKPSLKDLIQKGVELPFARVVENKHVVFTVKKG